MDWTLAIARNQETLQRVLATLLSMAGPAFALGREGAKPASLPRHLHRTILRLLRPVEAATRRLVVIAARDMPLPAPRLHTDPKRSAFLVRRNGLASGTGIVLPRGVKRPGTRPRPQLRILALPLADPLKRIAPARARQVCVPRILAPGIATPMPVRERLPCRPSDAIDATRLRLRIRSVARVLDDLPAAAQRLVRWRAAQAAPQLRPAVSGDRPGRRKSQRLSPLRPGRPPGAPRRSVHQVHDLLDELHGLAVWAFCPPDTS